MGDTALGAMIAMNKRNGYLEWLLGREEESKSQKGKDRKDNGASVALINKRTEALYSTVAVEGIVLEEGFRFTRRGVAGNG